MANPNILSSGAVIAYVWPKWYWLISDNTGSRWSEPYDLEVSCIKDAEDHERKIKEEAAKKKKSR